MLWVLGRLNYDLRNAVAIYVLSILAFVSCVMRSYHFNMFEIPDVTTMSPDDELGHVNILDVCMFRSTSEEHGCRIEFSTHL